MKTNHLVEVKFKGSVEVPSCRNGRPGCRLTNGYAVVVDGKELQPWFPYRKAHALAKELRKEI